MHIRVRMIDMANIMALVHLRIESSHTTSMIANFTNNFCYLPKFQYNTVNVLFADLHK